MTDFNSAVADRANADAETVAKVLSSHQVRHWVAPPPAPPLTIRRVAFSGINADGVPYEFSWAPDTGTWALITVENNVGKSSVLDVIRWLLSGRDVIDDVVRAMIERAELTFDLGQECILVKVEGTRHSVTGTLTAGDNAPPTTFDEKTFEAVMDGTMMPRLGLQYIARWQTYPNSKDGMRGERGWTSLLPAFFLPAASSKALLGSSEFDAGMLLQVYLGLPWFSTHRECDVALKALDQVNRDVRRRIDRDAGAVANRVKDAEQRLKTATDKLNALPTPHDAEAQLREASSRLHSAVNAHDKALAIAGARTRELQDAERLRVQAAREVAVARETAAAHGLFSELRVEICPHCELDIDKERRAAEAERQICMVCDRPAGDPEASAQALLERALARDIEAARSLDVASQAAGQATRDVETRAAERRAAEAARDKATPNEKLLEQRTEARVAVALANGALTELRHSDAQTPEDPAVALERTVLRRAKDEAEERMKDPGLMEQLAAETAKLCVRFGMEGVKAITIDRAAHVNVTKGDVEQTFSKLRATEKLRVRIAIVVALLRLARPLRHPGLLVIDSPADAELSDDNLEAMLKEVNEICADIPRLQVLIATTRTERLQAAVPPEHVVYAGPGERLW